MSCHGMCRVCLSVDIKIYSIRDTQLQVIYEGLTKHKLITEDGRPETACYICLSQLQACHRFQIKSQKTEEIFTQLFQSGIKILQETVAILNKGIQHDFIVTPIEAYNCTKPLVVKIEDTTTQEETPRTIEELTTVQSDAALCRVCLVGVRSLSIKGTALQTIYEKLTNLKLVVPDRAESLCYICRCQLQKCLRLVSRAKRSEQILTELLRNGVEISEETARLLNSRTVTSLEVSATECLSYFAPGPLCTVDLSRNNLLSKSYALQAADEIVKKEFDLEKPYFKLKCGVCAHKYPGLAKFRYHLRLHAVARRYACNLCSYRFKRQGSLNDHKKQVHITMYTCPKCQKKFKDKSKLNTHVKTHDEVMYECDICEKMFINKKYVVRHKKYVHGGCKYTCDRCNIPFPTELSLKIHVINVHNTFPYYVCDYCRKKMKTKSTLRKHMRSHSEKRSFKCDVCEKCFKDLAGLNQHLKMHEKAYKCDHCLRKFSFKYQLDLHVKYHLNQKDFICEICEKGFVGKEALKTHIKVHIRRRYVCEVCNAKFVRKLFYEEHIQQHKTGVQRYMCNVCGKIYSLQGQLRLHKYKCNKPKVQRKIETCSVCQKQTKSLKNHMKIHNGEKPYSCDICGKAFRSSGNRLNHQRTHYGLKQFGCHECGNFFARKNYLIQHISTHDTAKPYKCDICDAAYSHPSKLTHHKYCKHREKKVYPCDKCESSYTEKRSLDFHKTTHTKILQYICDLCYKVYIDRVDFIIHLKSHRRKKFTCEICKKRFMEMKNLARHMKQHRLEKSVCPLCKVVVNRSSIRRHYHMSHGGVKPYACNVCEEGFILIEKVYDHYMRCHSKEDRFVCDLCNAVLMRNGGLVRHMKNVHNIVSHHY